MDMDLFMQIMGGESRYAGDQSTTFTPPHIAKEMVDLLPDSVWNDKTTFLDLYCKTGVFLVEIYNRLDEALKKMPAYTDDQVRRTHILNEQLFGLSASDGMPLLMSQRNLYGQIGVGNIRYIGADNMGYTDIIKQNDIDLLKACLQREFGKMNFDVVIGNPPYNRGMDLDFVHKGFLISTQYTCMITPAKWQTAEADQKVAQAINYGEFRKEIVPHMSHVTYYAHTPEVFRIAMTEGISTFLLDKCIHSTCIVTNICKIQPIFNGTVVRDIRHTESLVNIGNEIFEHLRKQSAFSHFRFTHNEGGLYSVWLTNMTNTGGGGSVAGLFNRQGACMGLSVCRLIIPGDDTHNIGTQSKKVFSSDNVDTCKSFISWLNCRLTRFMVVIAAKQTGILNDFGFRFVPAPPSGRFDHIYTDKELYGAFNLPQNYIDTIEAVIKERK